MRWHRIVRAQALRWIAARLNAATKDLLDAADRLDPSPPDESQLPLPLPADDAAKFDRHYGGWLRRHGDADFYVVDVGAPSHWTLQS